MLMHLPNLNYHMMLHLKFPLISNAFLFNKHLKCALWGAKCESVVHVL